MPVTASWQTYATLSKTNLNLTAGQHVLRICFESNNTFGFAGNYNWFSLASNSLSEMSYNLEWGD